MIRITFVLALIAVSLSVVWAGHCSSQQDQNGIDYMNRENDDSEELRCLLACLGFEWCVTTCYVRIYGLSVGCAHCFSKELSCIRHNCPIFNFGKQKEDCDEGCDQPFHDCAGDIPQPNLLTDEIE